MKLTRPFVLKALLLVSFSAAWGQSPSQPESKSSPEAKQIQQNSSEPAKAPLVFDAASVKVNKSPYGPVLTPNFGIPGRVTATDVSLTILIRAAYRTKPGQYVHSGTVLGAPAWSNSENFDVEAVAQGNPTTEQKRRMLQSLLVDRFKLSVHSETRQLPIYALLRMNEGKIGRQLMPHSEDAKCVDFDATASAAATAVPLNYCGMRFMVGVNGPQMSGIKATIEALASAVGNFVDRPVVDQSGLSGDFDFTLTFRPEPGSRGANASVSEDTPSIFTALQEQLGLKPEATTGPVDVLVIDHVEEPTAN